MDYLKIYNTLDSTNKEAHRLLAAGPVTSGLTILARHQTDGRGQYGRIWLSKPDDHLAMSIVYKPKALDVTSLATLGMKVSLGILQGLKAIDPRLSPLIKWPNDIYLDGKKLCGLLIENSISGTRVQHSIIGIGMNVNESDFPPEIPNAISLTLGTGYFFEINEVAITLRQAVLDILEATPSDWKNEYDQSLFGLNAIHQFQNDQESFQAKVLGISLEGLLQLELMDGSIRSFASHELKWEIR